MHEAASQSGALAKHLQVLCLGVQVMPQGVEDLRTSIA